MVIHERVATARFECRGLFPVLEYRDVACAPLLLSDRIFFVTVNLRRRVAPPAGGEYALAKEQVRRCPLEIDHVHWPESYRG